MKGGIAMNVAKRILVVALTIIMALGVSGCMGKKLSAEEKKEKMLAHLEEKYGEEFIPLSLSGSGHAYSYDRLYAYPKKGVEKDSFEVWGTQMEDGSYRISDGYFGIFIKDEYEAVMKSIVAETYKDFKLYTTFGEGVKPDRLNKNTKIEEIYNKDELFRSDTLIFIKEESAEWILDKDGMLKIAKKMREKKMVGSFSLFIVFNDKFESVGLQTLSEHPSITETFLLRDDLWAGVTFEMKIRIMGEEVKIDG